MDFCLYSTFFIMLIGKNIQTTDIKDSFWNRMLHFKGENFLHINTIVSYIYWSVFSNLSV